MAFPWPGKINPVCGFYFLFVFFQQHESSTYSQQNQQAGYRTVYIPQYFPVPCFPLIPDIIVKTDYHFSHIGMQIVSCIV